VTREPQEREPVSLAAVNAGMFRALLHAPLFLTPPGGMRTAGTLEEINEQPSARPEWRAPFSLVFHVPHDPAAPRPVQGTLCIEHQSLGSLEVFAVPLQPLGGTARWQVIFG
jgi:Domain of unknown function (DUF6916)